MNMLDKKSYGDGLISVFGKIYAWKDTFKDEMHRI